MKDVYESYEHAGLTVEICPDSDADSPEMWGDNNVVLMTFHRDCSIGKKFSKDTVIAVREYESYSDEEKDEVPEVKDILEKYHVFGVEAYIHSGVVLALSKEGNFCDRRWDVSEVGALFISKEEWPDREAAMKYARGHIETWNQYLCGDVWGYVIKDASGEHLDSCWGYYGIDCAKSEANSQAEWYAKDIRKKHEDKLKTQIKHRVPLNKRNA